MKHYLLTAILIGLSGIAFAQDASANQNNKGEACNPEQIYAMTDGTTLSYQGGLEQMHLDINEQLNFDKKVNGQIYVMVIVNCKNEAYSFQKLRGIDHESDAKIVEVMRGLQNWSAGTHEGQKVDCSIGLYMTLRKGKIVNIE